MAEELEAIALEDDDPSQYVGDEADAPSETGDPVAEADLDPPAGDPPESLESNPPAPAAKPWRVAKSLVQLRKEIDARWPNRDHTSDGTIGDQAHCGNGRTSDHCPNAAGVVRALDVDASGIPAAKVAEHIRKIGASGDPRLANGGYVIYNSRIASWSHGWTWRAYTGDNPHTSHAHISVSRDPSGYDNGGGWKVKDLSGGGTNGQPHPDLPKYALGSRVLKLTEPPMRGTDVAFVQRWVGAADDATYGPKTKARVERFQGIAELEVDGVVGPATWRAMRVG
jgi:hypothetical protein